MLGSLGSVIKRLKLKNPHSPEGPKDPQKDVWSAYHAGITLCGHNFMTDLYEFRPQGLSNLHLCLDVKTLGHSVCQNGRPHLRVHAVLFFNHQGMTSSNFS